MDDKKRKAVGEKSGVEVKRVKGAAAAVESSFTEELKADPGTLLDRHQWQRPDVNIDSYPVKPLVWQWLTIDMYEGKPLSANPRAGHTVPGAKAGPVPVIQLYGVTDDHHSVLAHVHGVTPYFYAAPPPGFTERDIPAFQGQLNEQVSQAARQPNSLLHIKWIEGKQSLMGYHFNQTRSFLQIFVSMPTIVPKARGLLERGFSFGSFPSHEYQCFEANIPFTLRYMIDADIPGCCWLEAPSRSYSVRHGYKKVSSCQIEIDIVFDSIVVHPPELEWQRIAPLRVLSFDIECQGRKGHFPEPEIDPVIQIANIIKRQGSETPLIRNVFVLDTCEPIVGADVLSFATEGELLSAWARFIRETDPDILTGYNIANFDLPYLLKRAATLGLKDFAQIGRLIGRNATMRDTVFSSSAFGKRENVETTIHGRTSFDMLQYMRREHKLSSYSLNAVSAHFLGEQKEDVHHSIISDLQMGTPDDRRRLAVYCIKDAFLPMRLMDKLMVLVNYIEMARVTGVPLDFLLSRGQQIKVVSMLCRKCKLEGLLMPTMTRRGGGGDTTYEGATVIEPKKAYYDTPIATLDFASLYPSIMMAHNLCYSTLVARSDISKLSPDQYQKSPCGPVFVKAETQSGLLPRILQELLEARSRAKADMKKATDPMVKAVQNGRQLALKISANSVYGFTGATVGQLPCLEISSSVTAYGRQMIDTTKEAVEKLYTVHNGYPADADVVYGDTDSVMVRFGVKTVAEAMKLGEEAAEEVSKLFPNPVRLEFEKVYFPYLLMNKKRYAGLYWTNPRKPDKLDAKGIETVRRDNCALARRVVDTCLRKILVERSPDGAQDYVKGVIADLLQNKIDISLLVITKALGKSADDSDYKAKQAHVELAKRMRERDPGTAPAVGDRVPYVIIQAAKGAPAYTKSEDPIYVLEHNIPIDNRHYLEHQLMKPLQRIFEPIVGQSNSLFTGAHTRTISKPTPSVKTGLMAFAVKSHKCMGCKTVLKGGRKTLCAHCESKRSTIYRGKLDEMNVIQDRFSRLWTQCQRCQGSLHQDVLCSNRDCPIFYMRKKVQKDLKDATDTVDLFDTSW